MSEKIGRNDPCFCGSGKKYKNCCYGKETKKTYTPEGKRKFTAKVLSSSGEVLFQNISGPPMPTAAEPFESLRFKQTKENYNKEDEPAVFERPEPIEPTPLTGDPEQPPELFEETKESYEKKD